MTRIDSETVPISQYNEQYSIKPILFIEPALSFRIKSMNISHINFFGLIPDDLTIQVNKFSINIFENGNDAHWTANEIENGHRLDFSKYSWFRQDFEPDEQGMIFLSLTTKNENILQSPFLAELFCEILYQSTFLPR